MDEKITTGLVDKIVEDLTAELEITDPMFDNYSTMIPIKVRNAVSDVINARKYPSSYSDSMILTDLKNYYSQIRKIALYDYNSIGEEGHISHSESGMAYSKISRETLFNGIVPISILV